MKNNLFPNNLGRLAEPSCFQETIVVSGLTSDVCIDYLEKLMLIRSAERQLALARKDGIIGGPVHLGVGQEAVAVGVSAFLNKTDRVFGAHRSHSHMLALGTDVYGLFAEVLGRNSGVSKGMGGSMHLWDQSNGFYGSVPIVAGTVPLAVGAGLAAKLQGVTDIGVAYFGDGSVEEGVVHESLNLARIFDIPVLFVVENNLFASHMHISQRQPEDSVARFAHANSIPYKLVDGNNVVEVADAASKLIFDIRNGGGPRFLEAVTYRWYGHVDWREDIDVGVHRSTHELENWRARDPIERFRKGMVDAGYWSDVMQSELEEKINQQIQDAWNKAMIAPYPHPDDLLERVYAK